MDFWVLVASRSGATIYGRNTGAKRLRVIEEIDHPSGRKHDRDFNSDRPGRAYDRAGHGRHALSWSEMPAEHHARAFARQLAEVLDRARIAHCYQQLVLVAEPRFLGMLRVALDPVTTR